MSKNKFFIITYRDLKCDAISRIQEFKTDLSFNDTVALARQNIKNPTQVISYETNFNLYQVIEFLHPFQHTVELRDLKEQLEDMQDEMNTTLDNIDRYIRELKDKK